MLATHFHLAPRLGLSGAVPHLPLHAFMAWTGPTFCFINYSPSARYEGIWGIGGIAYVCPFSTSGVDGVGG